MYFEENPKPIKILVLNLAVIEFFSNAVMYQYGILAILFHIT